MTGRLSASDHAFAIAAVIGTAALGIVLMTMSGEQDREPVGRAVLPSIYEPSGAQSMPDGRVLVVEDEPEIPFSIVRLAADGVSVMPVPASSLPETAKGKRLVLDDLEGLDGDGGDTFYAITSFSRKSNGKRDRDTREHLIRFRVEGDRLVDLKHVENLRGLIAVADPALAAAAGKKDDGLNIEALAYHRETGRLLIGFRSPVVDERAVILAMTNPAPVFDEGAAPQFDAMPVFLDLDRGGVRALTYDPVLDGYLILSRREDKSGKRFKLWLWDGRRSGKPRRIRFDGDARLDNAEGLTPVRVGGRERLFIVIDDGDRDRGRDGHYLLLDYDGMRIDDTAPD